MTVPRDPLSRFYTPDDLASRMVTAAMLDRTMMLLPAPRVIVEFSVGGGSFIGPIRDMWPDATVIGVDVDPEAEGLAKCDRAIVGDWLQVAPKIGRVDLAIGNVPFNRDSGRVSKKTGKPIMEACGHLHVAAALEISDHTVSIVPWDPICAVDTWACIYSGPARPRYVDPIRTRPWPANVRGTASCTWFGDGTTSRRKELRDPIEWS